MLLANMIATSSGTSEVAASAIARRQRMLPLRRIHRMLRCDTAAVKELCLAAADEPASPADQSTANSASKSK
jgi:hypothetical protein